MSLVVEKIYKILNEKKLSQRNLSELLNKHESYISHILKGNRPFSKKILKKLIPILEISKEEFETWALADKYSKELLELVIQTRKDFPYKKKSILTTKIDALLEEKEMSRTDLSKKIEYNQSGLNQIITRKRNMSEPVMQKLSEFFEISQDEIKSWIVADKHKLEILEQVYKIKQDFLEKIV